MEDSRFDTIKSALDAELDALGKNPKVGIVFGLSLYSEFRRRGLFKDKLADFIVAKWVLPSYRDLFVCEGPQATDDGYKVGTPNA